MIKKPKYPTLADYVRGNQDIINAKMEATSEYKTKVFNAIAKEFGTESPLELIIQLAEKYHEPYRRNQQQGRKLKWTAEIEAMLAVFIELRLEQKNHATVTDDIDWLIDNTAWGNFARRGNIKETTSAGQHAFRKHYNAGKKSPQFQIEMELLNENQDAWVGRLKKYLLA